MITIKAEVLKGKQKSDGTYNVKIRMTYKREVKRLPTSIYVRKEDLTKAFKIKNPKFIKEANNIVRQYQELCASLPLETANYSLNDIIECIKVKNERKTTIDFIQFSKEWLKTTQLKGKANYQTSINAFITYLGKEHLNTDQITKKLLKDFMNYLQLKRAQRIEELKKHGKRIPSNRMLSLYIGCLRHLYNEVKKRYNDYDRNIILVPNSPFDNLEIPKQEATRKRAIPAEAIKKIWELPYQYNNTGKEKKFSQRLLHYIFLPDGNELNRLIQLLYTGRKSNHLLQK